MYLCPALSAHHFVSIICHLKNDRRGILSEQNHQKVNGELLHCPAQLPRRPLSHT